MNGSLHEVTQFESALYTPKLEVAVRWAPPLLSSIIMVKPFGDAVTFVASRRQLMYQGFSNDATIFGYETAGFNTYSSKLIRCISTILVCGHHITRTHIHAGRVCRDGDIELCSGVLLMALW